jgi:hypothetical protein
MAGKKFGTLPLAFESLLSVLFIMDNMEQFQVNYYIRSINTSHKHDLHRQKEKEAYLQGSNYSGQDENMYYLTLCTYSVE